MNIPTTHVDGKRHKGQRLALVRLQQNAESRKRYIAQIPKWRHPLVGYLTEYFVNIMIYLAVLKDYHSVVLKSELSYQYLILKLRNFCLLS